MTFRSFLASPFRMAFCGARRRLEALSRAILWSHNGYRQAMAETDPSLPTGLDRVFGPPVLTFTSSRDNKPGRIEL